MCGRLTLTLPDFETLSRLLGVAAESRLAARYRRRWNVAPTDAHWIVVPREGSAQNAIVPASWGFGRERLINARSESVARNNLFKGAFAAHRCVVPADGFYEWQGEKGDRSPYWIHPRAPDESPLLLFASIYDPSPDGLGFAILTTASNATVAALHDRMPVIVPRERLDEWLRGDDPAALLAKAPDDLLVATAVSRRVNSVRYDDPECLAPPPPSSQERREDQLDLFRR